MTDNEIIKALEFCIEMECSKCPMNYDDCEERDFDNLVKRAIPIFNRQKAEIENYSHNNRTMTNSIYEMQKIIESQKAEIERNRDIITRQSDVVTEQREKMERIWGDAIKEFAERVKADCLGDGWFETEDWHFAKYLDNLVKEMVGDGNENV